jgi:hypothetical protein
MKRHAKVVFVGEVLEIAKTPKQELEAGATQYAVRFRVNRYWKSVKTSEVIVHTDMVGCGPHFEIGKKYLVYAFGETLETRFSRTKELAFADEDLRAIGPGKELREK